jgi:hypothetical protein
MVVVVAVMVAVVAVVAVAPEGAATVEDTTEKLTGFFLSFGTYFKRIGARPFRGHHFSMEGLVFFIEVLSKHN